MKPALQKKKSKKCQPRSHFLYFCPIFIFFYFIFLKGEGKQTTVQAPQLQSCPQKFGSRSILGSMATKGRQGGGGVVFMETPSVDDN